MDDVLNINGIKYIKEGVRKYKYPQGGSCMALYCTTCKEHTLHKILNSYSNGVPTVYCTKEVDPRGLMYKRSPNMNKKWWQLLKPSYIYNGAWYIAHTIPLQPLRRLQRYL